MRLPCFGLPPPWAGRREGGGAAANGPARRLTGQLPTLQRSPSQWRSLLVHARDLQTEIDSMEPPPSLTGKWHKNKEASDPMDEACDMVALPWLYRKAIAVLNTLELEDSGDHFMTNLKAGGVMDVVEKYPWSGKSVEHPRRDKRRGTHTAHVERSDAGPRIVAHWEDPYGGDCTDTFQLSPDGGTLTQLTDMTIRSTGQRTQYKTVFHRVHSSK